MPWNDKDGGPWGKGPTEKPRGESSWEKKPSSRGGPSPEDFVNLLQQRLKDFFSGGPKKPRKQGGLFLIGLAILVFMWIISGFYRVNEGEVGVVLRFGEMIRITQAGLRYHLPTPLERVIVRRVAAVSRIDGGGHVENARSENAEQPLILTVDENMVLTNYTILWRIKDIKDFLFTAREPEEIIRVAAESVLREIFGLNTARFALTEGRDVMGQKIQDHLQKLLDEYRLGIDIVSVQLQRVDPPPEVIEAFNDVQASLIDADRFRNEAEGYRNDNVPKAEGDAQKIMKDAEAYAQQVVAKAEGEAARFSKLLESVNLNEKYRQIIMSRNYLDTMQEVLSQTDKIILDSKAAKGVASYLPLNELRKAAKLPEKEATP